MAEKMSKAQMAALSQWDGRETSIYHAGGVRFDVGKRLLDMGMIEPIDPRFRPEYSICRLTPAGRAALQKDTNHG